MGQVVEQVLSLDLCFFILFSFPFRHLTKYCNARGFYVLISALPALLVLLPGKLFLYI